MLHFKPALQNYACVYLECFYSFSDLLKILILWLYIAKDSLDSQVNHTLMRKLALGLFIELDFLTSLSLALLNKGILLNV